MRFQYLSAAVCLITLLSLGCGSSNDVADSASPSSPDSAAAAETTTLAQVDAETTSQPIQDTGLRPDPNYPVPDQPAEQLLGFINHLATIPARGETEDEFIADQAGRARSRLFAADRIILTKGITEDLLEAGVRAKLDALRTLALLEPQGLGQDFPKFIEALSEGDSEKFARLGKLSRFWLEVDRLNYAQANDAQGLLKELESLLTDESAGEAAFLAAQSACEVLNRHGYQDEATQALKQTGNRFLSHPQLGEEAKDLLRQTAFREKVIAAISGRREAVRDLFLEIRDLLMDPSQRTVETLHNTLNAAQVLEYNSHFQEANKVFTAIERAFEKVADKDLASQAALSVSFAKKRLAMVGQEVRLDGKHVDGRSFNWNEYKGKVVLVDFWATTSAPWLNSLDQTKAAYDRFHSEGFEVVGINVDRDPRAMYDFLKSEGLPWTTLFDDVTPGLEGNANAIRFGIRAVPFVMLVGRDGKVSDIHIRGPKLTERIQELLAEPSSQNAKKTSDVERK